MRRLACMAMLACAGCATQAERIERSRHVEQRMLVPRASAGAANAIETYRMQPQERFRMPQPLDAPSPALPQDSSRASLPPTTVCVRLVVDAKGAVQRVDPWDDRDECHAGAASENADLMQAVRDGLTRWTFMPAAVCAWPAEARPPEESDDCAGADRMEPVPVSLLYAFTFEVREGKATVAPRRVGRD
ncbi:MAG: hypothetical protein QM761_00970 [Pseudoxanthomonas sp.]